MNVNLIFDKYQNFFDLKKDWLKQKTMSAFY